MTARLHHAARRRGGSVAAGGACAATGKIAPYLNLSPRSAQVSPNGLRYFGGTFLPPPLGRAVVALLGLKGLASRDWPQGIGLNEQISGVNEQISGGGQSD